MGVVLDYAQGGVGYRGAMIILTALLLLAPMGSGSVWDRLARCESGGNWAYNGSSGFDGGLQFSPSTWTAMGGPTQFAYQASRSQQIAVAQRLWEVQGWGAWPGCANRLGLWGTNPTQDSSRVDAQADAPEVDPELLESDGPQFAQLLEAEELAGEEVEVGPGEEEAADHGAEVDEAGEGHQAGLPVTS